MKKLKSALIKIKKISPTTYESQYKAIYNMYLNNSFHGLDVSKFDLDDLITALTQSGIVIKKIKGIAVIIDSKTEILFPQFTYDCDGGSPIYTYSFNLKKLTSSDFGGGLLSVGSKTGIVTLKDPQYPGLSINDSPEENLGEIHIFE